MLEVPVFCSEQYPKAFGNTVPELQAELTKESTYPPFLYEKKLFSMMTPEDNAALAESGRKQVPILF